MAEGVGRLPQVEVYMKYSDKRIISDGLMENIRAEIRAATDRKGLTDTAVAEIMGVTRPYYARMKNAPDQVMKFLEYIANILDCDVDIRFIPKSRKK